MTDSDRARSNYHHGDLERALIEAGTRLIEQQGIEALSMRAVAQAAGVSHAAPYHHFPSKTSLLAAIAAAGFDRMVDAIARQAQLAQAVEPIDRLRAVGRGYVYFAVDNPSVFRLMFRPELTRPSDHPPLLAAEGRTFGTLLEAIIATQQTGLLSGDNPLAPAAYAWSTVHGMSLLAIDNVLAETPIIQLPFGPLAERVNEAVITGLQAVDWSA